jgi:serine protease Do
MDSLCHSIMLPPSSILQRLIVTHPRFAAYVLAVALPILVGCHCGQSEPAAFGVKDNQDFTGIHSPDDLGAAPVTADAQASFEGEQSQMLVQDPVRSVKKPEFSGSLNRNSKHRSSFFMLRAFNDAVGEAFKSTVEVRVDGEATALGTIVDADGWVITKASELCGQTTVDCVLSDQREFAAQFVASDTDMDIALLKLPISGLSSITWDYTIPERGRWLATTDIHSGVPAAIGVVGAGTTSVPKQRAVLGVLLENAGNMRGALVTEVLAGSGAYEAGMRTRDVISEIDGKKVSSRDELLDQLRSSKGGQFLKLVVNRTDQILEKRVRLMDISSEMLDETEMEVNGPISARSTGFARVFTHDSVLQPNQCGGPLVNLDGKAVGINIARAGRVSTYALPADILGPVINRLIQSNIQFNSAPTTIPVSAEANQSSANIP